MAKFYQVVLSAEAERNIESAYLWIAEANHAAAARWYHGMIVALRASPNSP